MDDLCRAIQEQLAMYNRMVEGPLRYLNEQRAEIENITRLAAGTLDPLRGLGLPVAALPDVSATIDWSRAVLDRFAMPDSVAEMRRVFDDQQRTIEAAQRTLFLPGRNFATEIATASTYLTMAHTAFSTVAMDRVGELTRAEHAKQERLLFLTEQLTIRHADLVASLSLPEGRLASVPPFVSELPAMDVFVHGGAIRSITPHEDYDEHSEERRVLSARVELAGDTVAFLEVSLEELKPAFRAQYLGAKARARERGPDWWAQWGSSMRRLFKGVFHTVAHDDLVLPWATNHNKPLDGNGRPTRATKIEWLCLHLQNDKYRDFVRTELNSALALVGLLDSTQHVDEFPEIEEQFEWTELRAEFALRQILTIWKNRNQGQERRVGRPI